MTAPICPYCGSPSTLVTGQTIHPRGLSLWSLHFWHCAPCDAYVGCHKPGSFIGYDSENRRIWSDGTAPLGRLANSALRAAKSKAHHYFDPLWVNHQNPREARKDAYKWLAEQLNIPPDQCHIGLFDEAQCSRVVRICKPSPSSQMPFKDA